MNTAKIYAAVAAVGFVLGAGITHYYYKNEINEIYEAQEAAVNAQKEKNDEEHREQARKLASAFGERDEANRRIDALLLDVERLRHEIRSGGMSTGVTDPGNPYAAKYAGCRKLLEESTCLLTEGGRLCGRIAADKDTLSGLVKSRK